MCISNIDNLLIDNAENLVIVMLVNNLLEYICNYFMTSRSLKNYYRDKIEVDEVDDNTLDGKSFEYKT